MVILATEQVTRNWWYDFEQELLTGMRCRVTISEVMINQIFHSYAYNILTLHKTVLSINYRYYGPKL